MLGDLRDRVWHRPLVIGGTGSPGAGRMLFRATAARIAARHPDAHFVWLDEEEGSEAHAAAEPIAGEPAMTVVSAATDPEAVLSQLAMLCVAGEPDHPALGLVPGAMAAAKPVVAIDVPGLDELVTDGETGALVPPGDAEALADAALGLLEDRGRLRSAGHAARAHAERSLGAEAMAQATAALYETSLLGGLASLGRTMARVPAAS
jgi:glycosyltransferase involved in cell wall biosynthesis